MIRCRRGSTRTWILTHANPDVSLTYETYRPPRSSSGALAFTEDGLSLCAVEYFSSGISGSAKNTIWMRKGGDARLQLVLAAAMTAVLEFETAAIEDGAAEP